MGKPVTIFADNEFNKHMFNNYFEDNNIRVIYSSPEEKNKNVYIERVNGTIRRLLQRYLLVNKTKDWVNGLKDVVNSYNNTIHSTIEEKPINLFENKKKSKEQYNLSYQDKFKEGDVIRVSRKKKAFDKGSESLLSKDIYQIKEILPRKFNIVNVKNNSSKIIARERAVKVEIPSEDLDIDFKVLDEPKQERKQEKVLNKEGIEQKNIIEGKRTRKPNPKYF